MASTMTAAQVVAAYGAYYQNRGQNRNSLANVLYRGSMTDQAFSSGIIQPSGKGDDTVIMWLEDDAALQVNLTKAVAVLQHVVASSTARNP